MELPIREQGAFIQRMLSLMAGLPPTYPVALTAGDLRLLLEAFAALAVPTQSTATADGAAKEAADSPPPLAGPRRDRAGKIDLIRRYLGSKNRSMRAKEIADGTGLAYVTAHSVLVEGPFERDPADRTLWRNREVNPAPMTN